MQDIKESDWKIFKGLRKLAFERFCDRVLGEIARIGSDNTKTKPERYRAIYRLVRERDKEINPIFDFVRRSTAIRQICAFRFHDLLTAQELGQFSPELVQHVEGILEIYNRPLVHDDEDDPIRQPPDPA